MDTITIGKVPVGCLLFNNLQDAARYAAKVGNPVMGISCVTEDFTYQVWYVKDDQTPKEPVMVDVTLTVKPRLTLIRGGKA